MTNDRKEEKEQERQRGVGGKREREREIDPKRERERETPPSRQLAGGKQAWV